MSANQRSSSGQKEVKNLSLEEHELIAQIIGKTKSLGEKAELIYRQRYLMDGQVSGASHMLSLDKKDDISKYALKFLKANMDTEKQIGQSMSSTTGILNGANEHDYMKSFMLLIEMIDRELDEYKGDMQQILFPMFIVLHLTMVQRGFEDGSQKFYDKFNDLFRSNQNDLNEELNLLKSIRTLSDLNSSLDYDKYLKNKFQIKLSFHANEILMQFLKFENMILLLQMINNYFEFKITKEKNIIDLIIAKKLAQDRDCKYPKLEASILVPFDKPSPKEEEEMMEEQDELILGRLPEFCPEAIIHQQQINNQNNQANNQENQNQDGANQPQNPNDLNVPKRTRKYQLTYNILQEPQIPLPQLDPLLQDKIETQLTHKCVYGSPSQLPTIGQISMLNTYRNLNCITISDSGAVIATGMADSTVKVFILSKKQHDVLTVDDMVQRQVKECTKNQMGPINNESNNKMEEEKEAAGDSKKQGQIVDKEKEKNAVPPQKSNQIAKDVTDDRDEYELIGHDGPVFAVTISICDKHLLSGSYDRTIRRWSLQTKGPLMVYNGHVGPVWDVKFAPLGSYFASCSADKTAKLWILKNTQPLRIFASQGGHLNDVEAVEFHPNMHYVVTGSSDKQVIVWEVQTGNQVRNFTSLPGAVRSLKFNRAGTYLYVGNDKGELMIYDFVQKIPLDVIQSVQQRAIWAIDISWDDSIVALGTESGTIELYSQQRILQNAGKQLKDLAYQLKNNGMADGDGHQNLIDDPMENVALLKCYYTKATQGGTLAVKFSWMNFLYTAGCVDYNFY